MIKNLKSKKAQIGKTITWFASFIVVFFIMLLFVAGCAALSGQKFLSREKNVIHLEEEPGLENLEDQMQLLKLLNTITEDGKTVKDTILEWKLSHDNNVKIKAENEIKNILDNDEDITQYLFKVNHHPGVPEEDYMVLSGEAIGFIFEEGPKLNLFLNGQAINVELYVSHVK